MRRANTDGRGPRRQSTTVGTIKAQVVAVVATIPEGRVTTYGAIARYLDLTARQVASALATFTEEESATLPWFRVVAAQGVISTMKLGAVGHRQCALLDAEGVAITLRHKVQNFAALFWTPA